MEQWKEKGKKLTVISDEFEALSLVVLGFLQTSKFQLQRERERGEGGGCRTK